MATLPTRKYLGFEMEARPLDEKLAALEPGSAEYKKLAAERDVLLKNLTAKLSPWERVQLARHPDRPYALDLIGQLVAEFEPLAGDRLFGEDAALVAGLGRIGGRAVAVLAQQKGRTAEERAQRSFGMVKPEGYRKAQRILDLAGRFDLPVVTIVDTPGAHPGIEAEERGQAQAIAETLIKILETPTPTVALVLGEGGSGGALALAACDKVLMSENAIYSVISPEGCASILWKDSAEAPQAAAALRGDAGTLKENGIIDEGVSEPVGGAHRDPRAYADTVGKALAAELKALCGLSTEKLLAQRRARYRAMTSGAVKEAR